MPELAEGPDPESANFDQEVFDRQQAELTREQRQANLDRLIEHFMRKNPVFAAGVRRHRERLKNDPGYAAGYAGDQAGGRIDHTASPPPPAPPAPDDDDATDEEERGLHEDRGDLDDRARMVRAHRAAKKSGKADIVPRSWRR
jgi:hypothetical protein